MSLHKLASYLCDSLKLISLRQALYKKQRSTEQNSPRMGPVLQEMLRGWDGALERQLSSDWQSQERRLTDIAEFLATLSRLREQAKDQLSTAIKRTEAAEATLSE